MTQKRIVLCLLLVLCLGLSATTPAMPTAAQDAPKVSRMGEYSGYSQPVYKEWARTSQYVAVRDGTRLAVDIVRPVQDGKPVDAKLPVIYIHERYQRARVTNGKIVSQATMSGFWETWVSHGYVLITADVRGGGASFGSRPGEMMDVDSTDAYDIIQWIAAQPWSNGSVGMIGISYNAITQYMAAGSAPPALKAIIPHMAIFDLYSFVYPGGIYRYEFMRSWAQASAFVDKALPPVPVDEDTNGELAAQAVQEHTNNANVYETVNVPYRDSVWERLSNQPYKDFTLSRFAAGINKSNVAVYQFAGWFDMWPGAQATWFNNLTVPQRIAFTPFPHGIGFVDGWQRMIPRLANDVFNDDTLYTFHMSETLRFFDYHLKGIDNGIMAEPPVWYYVMGAPAGEAWRNASQWPLPEEVRTLYYLAGEPSNGLLSTEKPTAEAASDDYTVDYSTTMGQSTRWHNGHGGNFFYGDMSEQAAKSLTYTTDALSVDTEVTGHPVVRLWVTSTADDGDFFVSLEEVDENGYAQYITEGMLRASHRKLSDAPYNNMGLPYHRSFAEDIAPLPKGQPVELVFDLLPTSNIFDAGHRIRIRITGADADNHLTPRLDPPPTVSIYRSAEYPSSVDLPIIPAK